MFLENTPFPIPVHVLHAFCTGILFEFSSLIPCYLSLRLFRRSAPFVVMELVLAQWLPRPSQYLFEVERACMRDTSKIIITL